MRPNGYTAGYPPRRSGGALRKGFGMGKTFMLAAVLAVTLSAVLATPAYPQTVAEDLAADEDGNLVGPRPPDYEATEGGMLIIGGDVLIPCSDIGKPSDPPGAGEYPPAVRAEIEQSRRESILACQAAGFDTAGDVPSSATTLPETGGPALLAPMLLAAVATLVAGGFLLVLGARRRSSCGACPRVDRPYLGGRYPATGEPASKATVAPRPVSFSSKSS